jgi:hypothetical protein
MDLASREQLFRILRREGRSLFQYLREVPAWVGLHDRNAFARTRELAGAELEIINGLTKLVQKHHHGMMHLGAFPDFTSFNDTALNYSLPIIIREQKQLLAELERERSLITDGEAGAQLDQLLVLKRKHVPQLESLQTAPHSVTAFV